MAGGAGRLYVSPVGVPHHVIWVEGRNPPLWQGDLLCQNRMDGSLDTQDNAVLVLKTQYIFYHDLHPSIASGLQIRFIDQGCPRPAACNVKILHARVRMLSE